MTTMGLEYEKLLENRRHNYVTEDLGQQEVNVKKYTASFEPRKVAAQELSAAAQKQNADTNTYTASFEPRRVAAQELSARAQKQNADTNTYVASFKPREVAAQEKQANASLMSASASQQQAQASLMNAETNKLKYQLDKAIRNAELEIKRNYNKNDIRIRDFQNETNRLVGLSQQYLNRSKAQGTSGKIMAFAQAGYESSDNPFLGSLLGIANMLSATGMELLDLS